MPRRYYLGKLETVIPAKAGIHTEHQKSHFLKYLGNSDGTNPALEYGFPPARE